MLVVIAIFSDLFGMNFNSLADDLEKLFQDIQIILLLYDGRFSKPFQDKLYLSYVNVWPTDTGHNVNAMSNLKKKKIQTA